MWAAGSIQPHMEYSTTERGEKHQGHNWFGHNIKLNLRAKRRPELEEFLLETIGPKGHKWRELRKNRFNVFYDEGQITLRFKDKRDAMRFKLTWDECPEPLNVMEYFKKLALNSNFGAMSGGVRRGAIQVTAPTYNPTPFYSWTQGIHPTSGKLNIVQHKSRNTKELNPCREIIMDWEGMSTKESDWLEYLFPNCDSWTSYSAMLDASIRREEKFAQQHHG